MSAEKKNAQLGKKGNRGQDCQDHKLWELYSRSSSRKRREGPLYKGGGGGGVYSYC